MNDRQLELYFHIPFCVQKCLYCDFLSAPASSEVQNSYMQALFCELEARAAAWGFLPVTSIFIGGGTPSLVEPQLIAELLRRTEELFTLEPDCEITLEANPGTLSLEKLHIYRAAGVNRLSIGLQSACDRELQILGRIHDYSQFMDSYRNAVLAGFDRINVDLISAIPGQTVDSYVRSLEAVIALEPRPEHISAYSLIIEEGTPYNELYSKGQLSLPDEDEERTMYEITGRILEREGYRRYEISNYSLPGRECRHNVGYWTGVEYLGMGIGAASLLEGHRLKNQTDLDLYIQDPVNCVTEDLKLTPEDRMEEFVFLGLRLMKGISCNEFKRRFGRDIFEVYAVAIDDSVRDRLMVVECGDDENGSENDRIIRLTERGIALSNYVFGRFLL